MTGKYVYVLSVAASATRLGYVFWIDGEPEMWGLSRQASRSMEDAYEHVHSWIGYLRPQLLITERPNSNSRKGRRTHMMLETIAKAARESSVEWIYVDRVQAYRNKYEEAEELAHKFPAFEKHLPGKRRLWEEEASIMTIFEALALPLTANSRQGFSDGDSELTICGSDLQQVVGPDSSQNFG